MKTLEMILLLPPALPPAHVRQGVVRECKCHGMSGSCAIRTCWRTLAPFRTVGSRLKDRYDDASRVLPGNEGNMRAQTRRRRPMFVAASPSHRKPGRRDLVFFQPSPSFCQRDVSLGVRGTRGRQCNSSSAGGDGCQALCCGRGFQSRSYTARERCSCTFHWCCQVTCRVCSVTRSRRTCN
ncbi:hypothetical protein ACOMHN_003558 [Nucella lapillus]